MGLGQEVSRPRSPCTAPPRHRFHSFVLAVNYCDCIVALWLSTTLHTGADIPSGLSLRFGVEVNPLRLANEFEGAAG
jgi:hypothetical protein